MNPIQSDMETGHRLQRALRAVTGVLIFFWIGYEDRSSAGPILVGSMIASALAANISGRLRTTGMLRSGGRPVIYTLTGLIAGALAMPLAALAMLVKVSLHSHIPPDFTTARVFDLLARTPIWAGAGILIGLACALARRQQAHGR
jgi:hypothetical protein